MKMRMLAAVAFCSLVSSVVAMEEAVFDMSQSMSSIGSGDLVLTPESPAKGRFSYDESELLRSRQAPESPNKMGFYFEQEVVPTLADQKSSSSWSIRSASSASSTKGASVKSPRDIMDRIRVEALVGTILDCPEALSVLVRHKKFSDHLSKNPLLLHGLFESQAFSAALKK